MEWSEFVDVARDRIDTAELCVEGYPYPFDQLAFSIILEYLIGELDPPEE